MSTTFRFTLRTDSAADWQAKNPVLSKGEPGLEEVGDGTFRQKVGDGVTAWADLPYVGAGTEADVAALQQQVATKADEQSVADRLAAKANASSLAAKADKTYVDTEVATRATKAEVAPALPAAVDRNSGAVLRHKLATNQNCVWAHLGDSTANGTDEWLYLALDRLRLDYPNMRVTHELWNDTTQAYDAATVLQAGTSEDEPASSFFDGFGRTGTLVGSSTETGAAQWQGGSSAGSTDGSAWQYAGFAGWFNHTMDPKAPEGIIGRVVATLAAGTTSTASLRLSILGDGSTGTDELMVGLGQNANSITYSVYWRDGQTANLVSTGSGNSIAVDNSVPRKVELSLALKGTAVTATLKLLDGSGRTSTGTGTLTAPSTWAGFGKKAFRIHGGATIPVDSVSLGLMGKDPATLRVINGSMPGANLTYFQAAGRIAKMLPVDADLLTIASSHNHGTQAVAAYVQQVKDTLDQYALPLVPSAGVVLVSQNPQFAPIAQANQDAHLARLRAIKPLAKERGYGYIAGVEEFLKQADRGKSATNADGVHPIAAGSALWRDAALRFLRGDTGKADRTYVDTEVGKKLDTTVAAATYAVPTVKVTHPQGLARWRKARGQALFQQVRVQCQGDSITAGAYANDTAGSTNADKLMWAQRGWVGQLRRLLVPTYGDAGEGWVGFGGDEGRWTYTNTVSGSAAGPIGLGVRLNVDGKAAAGADLGAFTDIEVLGFHATNSHSVTLFVDGKDETPSALTATQKAFAVGASDWSNRGNTALTKGTEGDEDILTAVAAGAANMSFQTPTGTAARPAAPGQYFAIGADLKSTAASRAWRVGVVFHDAAGVQISELTTVDGTASVVGSWQTKSNLVVAPAGTAYVSAIARIDAAGGAGEEHKVRRLRVIPVTAFVGQGGSTLYRFTRAGLVDGTHSVELRGPGGGTGSTLCGGVILRRGSAGVLVSRVAKSGSTSKNHAGLDQSAATQENMLLVNFNLMRPDLVVLALGANDFGDQGAGLTPAVFKTNLKVLTDRVAAVGGCTLLVAGPRYAAESTYTQAEYYAQMEALANEEAHVAFVDVGVGQWKNNATANTVGFMNNALVGVHPLMAGHGDYARTILEAITSRALGPIA